MIREDVGNPNCFLFHGKYVANGLSLGTLKFQAGRGERSTVVNSEW